MTKHHPFVFIGTFVIHAFGFGMIGGVMGLIIGGMFGWLDAGMMIGAGAGTWLGCALFTALYRD